MNLWIETARDSLVSAIGAVDLVLMNDAELRMLTEQPNLMRAAREVMAMGPRMVVAKQGEYGAALFTEDSFFALPGYPLEEVVDPTGAGDTFAGGVLGYLAAQGTIDDAALRRALLHGSVCASFAVERFSVDGIEAATRADIEGRHDALRELIRV